MFLTGKNGKFHYKTGLLKININKKINIKKEQLISLDIKIYMYT